MLSSTTYARNAPLVFITGIPSRQRPHRYSWCDYADHVRRIFIAQLCACSHYVRVFFVRWSIVLRVCSGVECPHFVVILEHCDESGLLLTHVLHCYLWPIQYYYHINTHTYKHTVCPISDEIGLSRSQYYFNIRWPNFAARHCIIIINNTFINRTCLEINVLVHRSAVHFESIQSSSF